MDSQTRIIYLHDSVGYELFLNGYFLDKFPYDNSLKLEFEINLLGESYNSSSDNARIKFTDQSGNESEPSWIADFEIAFDTPESYSKFFSEKISYNEALGRILEYDIIVMGFSPDILNLESVSKLELLKSKFQKLEKVLEKFPGKLFILVIPPPFEQDEIDLANAKRARNFERWFTNNKSIESKLNVIAFDSYTLLAYPDDNTEKANTLKYEYGNDSSLHLSPEASELFADELSSFIKYLSKGLQKSYKIKIY